MKVDVHYFKVFLLKIEKFSGKMIPFAHLFFLWIRQTSYKAWSVFVWMEKYSYSFFLPHLFPGINSGPL